MKTVDKFVLVPFERYERLINNHNNKDLINKQQESYKSINSVQKGGADIDKNTPIEEKRLNINDQSHSPITHDKDNLPKKLNLTNTQPDSAITEKKAKKEKIQSHVNIITKKQKKTKLTENLPIIAKKKKLPPPPPGIPNKIKAQDFKWFSLF